mmetsp:Transcript_10659/g.29488  ORF Transcript_10659/g.29488 Transcript_10659/m.29488 type:complete len:200 (-) Transcript_10659:1747-2346(-)
MEPHTLVLSVRAPLPVPASFWSPPGRMMIQSIEVPLSFSSAFSFSFSTFSSTAYTSSETAPLLSPVPIEVTRMNFCTPCLTAASIRLMFPCESAEGSADVPPMVEITASHPSIATRCFSMSSGFMASPMATMAIISSISLRSLSVRWSCQTHEPISFSFRVTESATPPPPATRMLALSGSMAAWVATFRVRWQWRNFVG